MDWHINNSTRSGFLTVLVRFISSRKDCNLHFLLILLCANDVHLSPWGMVRTKSSLPLMAYAIEKKYLFFQQIKQSWNVAYSYWLGRGFSFEQENMESTCSQLSYRLLAPRNHGDIHIYSVSLHQSPPPTGMTGEINLMFICAFLMALSMTAV